jgi:hypothetical protein
MKSMTNMWWHWIKKKKVFQLTSAPVLSDVFVIFLSSVSLLTQRGQFLYCSTIAFSERYHGMRYSLTEQRGIHIKGANVGSKGQ